MNAFRALSVPPARSSRKDSQVFTEILPLPTPLNSCPHPEPTPKPLQVWSLPRCTVHSLGPELLTQHVPVMLTLAQT